MNVVRHGGTQLPISPQRDATGDTFQCDKGTKAETCSVLTVFEAATAFHPPSPRRRRGSVLTELCHSPGTRGSSRVKDTLSIPPSSLSKHISATKEKGRGITVLAIPQAPSPSERVNPAFKSRLPPASSPPDVARHCSLMRLTCIFNVVIFWLWQLYRHRDYKRVTSMQ